ncbi:UNVERIFIED_CONTAM: hypothetical protein FKN15_033587 [Acipenser sinensis]
MPRGRPRKQRNKINAETDGQQEPNAENSGYCNAEPKDFKCLVCSKTFTKDSLLQRHLRDHGQNDKPHRCDLCPKSFNVEFNMTLHRSTHASVDPTCPVCHKKFSRVASLKAHIMLHEKEEVRSQGCGCSIREENGIRWHVCPYCAKEFKKPSDLVRHIRIHTHEKPFKCKQCFRAFAVKSTLTAHMKTHTGIKAFKCQFCMKCFSTSGSMKVHMRLHTGLLQNQNPRNHFTLPYYSNIVDSERPYKCPYCNKAYKKSSHLKQHVRSHTGERPFKCLQCSKGFASSGVLKAHIRTHSGLKAYKCLICDSTFTTSGSLRRHMATHSDLRPYMCPYCQKTFKSSPNCRKHMKTHRYELAQQLQQQQQTSLDDSMGQQAVTSEMQVEIEGDELHQPTSVSTEQQVMLGLSQQQVVGVQQAELEQQLNDQPLVQDEDTFVTPQHALPQNMSQFEQQAITQQAFDQQGLTQGFTITDGYNQQSQFSTVQQLQDSSTLESQALSSSFHQQNLLHVSSAEVTSRLLQEPSQSDLHLQTERTDFQEESDENSRRAYREPIQPMRFTAQLGNYNTILITYQLHLLLSLSENHRPSPQQLDELCLVNKNLLRQKLFNCHMCNTSFSTKGSLKVHMRLHTGSKPFKCPFCELRFRTSGHRKTHIQCHYKPTSEAKKNKKPCDRQSTEALPPVNLLNTSPGDPNVYITNNSVLTSQFEQNLLQQGLVGQAILPASMSAGGDLTVSLTEAGLATLEGIQLQLSATNLVGPNVQISGIDTTNINNITLQIDPSILQQTLQQGSILTHHLTGDSSHTQQAGSHLQTGDSTVPANVVIQPLSGLSLQPNVGSANITIGTLTEQDSVLTTSNSGTQDLTQVMTSQGMVTSSNNQHEITLTINNSSLSQVLAQATGSNSTNSSTTSQEITLTISGTQDLTQVMTSQGMVTSSNNQHEITLTINNSSLSQVLAQATGSNSTNSSTTSQEITLTISAVVTDHCKSGNYQWYCASDNTIPGTMNSKQKKKNCDRPALPEKEKKSKIAVGP